MTSKRGLTPKKKGALIRQRKGNPEVFSLIVRERPDQRLAVVNIQPGVIRSASPVAGEDVRSSLLCPVSVHSFAPPKGGDFDVLFIATENPVGLIHSLEKRYPKQLCFGLGLTSVVLIFAPKDTPKKIVAPDYAKTVVSERWNIRKNLLEKQSHTRSAVAPKRKLPSFKFDKSPDNHTLSGVITELGFNFERAVRFSELYALDLIPELAAAFNEASEILGECIALSKPVRRSQAPAGPSTKARIDANLELLVQINSALVYLITQAFHGTPPVLNHTPLISHQSVLGCGTAWRGVANIARRLFAALNNPPIPSKLAKELFTSGPKKHARHQHNRRLIHFSGRLGFGETDVALTCPSQVLLLCSTPQWSLATLTHEVLHAYVKRILAALFTFTNSKNVMYVGEDAVRYHAQKFLDTSTSGRSGYSGDLQSSYSNKNIDILRSQIFSFALAHRSAIRKIADRKNSNLEVSEFDIDVTAPKSAEKLTLILLEHYRLIEEVFVHVLDFDYFYEGHSELYCESLWITWAAVPSVIGRLDWYIFRTLLGLSSGQAGENFAPLDASMEILVKTMRKLRHVPECQAVCDQVLNRIVNDAFKIWIEILFPAALEFVRAITDTCASDTVRAALRADHDVLANPPHDYALEIDTFDTQTIQDPLAFVFSYLKKDLNEPKATPSSFETVVRRSIWMLGALGSVKSNSL